MASLKELIVKIKADTNDLTKGVNDAKKELEGLGTVGEGLVSIGAGLSASLTAPIVALGLASVTAGGQMEQTRQSFETLLGSAEKSASFLEELEDFAKSTPFEFTGLVDASKRMLAFGFESDKVLPTLTAIGDAVAALGGSTAMVDRVTTALGQMQAKGKVSAEEMLQLAEAGIPAWDMLAKAIGTDIPTAMKLAEKGSIEAGVAIEGLVNGMNERFGGLMEKQSQTLLGQISNLQDTFGQALTRLGEALIPFATKAVGIASSMVDAFSGAVDIFASLPAPIQGAIAAVAGLVAAVGPLITGVGALMAGWATLGPSITAAGSAIAAVATGPVGITVAAVAALTAAVVWLHDEFGVLDPVIAAAGAAFDAISTGIQYAFTNLEAFIIGIGVFAQEVIASNAPLAWLVDTIGGGLVAAFNAIGTIIKTVVLVQLEALGAVFSWVAEKAKALFDFFVDKGKASMEETSKAAKDTSAGVQEVGTAAAKATPPVKNLGLSLKSASDSAKAAKAEAKILQDALSSLGVKGFQNTYEHVGTLNYWLDTVRTAYQDGRVDVDRYAKAIANYNDELRKIANDGLAEFRRQMDSLKPSLEAVSYAAAGTVAAIQTWARTAADSWDSVSQHAAVKSNEIKEAFKELGIPQQATLDAAAQRARDAYDTIKTSGTASASEIEAAYNASLDAQIAAMEAKGATLSEAQKATLEQMKKDQESFKNASTGEGGIFSTWANDVVGIVKGMNIGEKLFSGDFSLTNAKKLLGDIGQAFTDKLKQPAIDAINGLIEKGIKALMGALDDLIGKLTGSQGVSQAMNAAFGTGATTATGGGIPGVGGGGGGGSSGGGLFNQITGAITAGASVADAILSHFGRQRAEATANAIEENTRTHMLLFADYRESVGFFQNDQLQYINASLDDMKATLWAIRDNGVPVSGLTGTTPGDLGTVLADSSPPGGEILDTVIDFVDRVAEALPPSRSRTSQTEPPPLSAPPSRSRSGQVEPPTPDAPLRSRTRQEAQEVGEVVGLSVAEVLQQRNPLAVAAAELGHPLAMLATGSNFQVKATEEQTAAISEQTSVIAVHEAAHQQVLVDTRDATVSRLDLIHQAIAELAAGIGGLADRPISIIMDGIEIARAVGAGQESLRSTA